MPLFQYQGKVEPLLPIPPPPIEPLTWLPHYPDQVPHRRSDLRPSFTYASLKPVVSVTEVRVTQAPVELVIVYGASPVRVTQAAVEALTQYDVDHRSVRVTQIAVEVVYPFGCFTFTQSLPTACPVPAPAVPVLLRETCPVPGDFVGTPPSDLPPDIPPDPSQ